jgi:pantoate--beta-alanine ligase
MGIYAETSLVQIAQIEEARAAIRRARLHGKTIGFVPTMGALHAGHAHLIEQAAQATDFVVVSIFVNPTQFGPSEDFERYPRTLESDLMVCERSGARLVFRPSVAEMYPFNQGDTRVELPNSSSLLCGAFRPGHFQGVATVVLKLLNIVAPDIAFFGEKDFQQLVIVKQMVADLNVPASIRGVPTVREPDGLALSSRNRYLSTAERAAATVLWRALQAAARVVECGEDDATRVRQILGGTIELESCARLQYADVVDSRSLQSLERLSENCEARAMVAAFVGTTRLIDNIGLPAARPKLEAQACS